MALADSPPGHASCLQTGMTETGSNDAIIIMKSAKFVILQIHQSQHVQNPSTRTGKGAGRN